jgi:hypothetical protein
VIPALLAAAFVGLFGTVMRGPIVPVCRAGIPCSAPAAGVTLTFSRGAYAKSIVTNASGSYRVQLAPGIYSVRLPGESRITRLTPFDVTVRRGPAVRRDFMIDTGIR